MSTNDTYAQIRKGRIAVIVFLLLTILAMVSSWYFYTELQKEKQALIETTQQLEESQLKLANSNKSLAEGKTALNAALDSIAIIIKKCPYSVSQEVGDVTEKAKIIAKDSKYQAIISLEREAFKRIIGNDFAGALELLMEAEKMNPGLHNIYEIGLYLRRHKSLFTTPEGQMQIKQKIISDYSWKAPEDLLAELKQQLQ